MDRYTLVVFSVSVLAALQRMFREDIKFFPSLPEPWRGLVVALVGMVAVPALDTGLNGWSGVGAALLTGLMSVLPTIVTILTGLLAAKPSVKVLQ